MIGHKNTDLKRIGISKLRLMAGRSANCVVCGNPVANGDFPANHLCPEHLDWEMVVVDSNSDRQESVDYLLGHENDLL